MSDFLLQQNHLEINSRYRNKFYGMLRGRFPLMEGVQLKALPPTPF